MCCYLYLLQIQWRKSTKKWVIIPFERIWRALGRQLDRSCGKVILRCLILLSYIFIKPKLIENLSFVYTICLYCRAVSLIVYGVVELPKI